MPGAMFALARYSTTTREPSGRTSGNSPDSWPSRDEPAPRGGHVVARRRRGKVLDALSDQAARRDAEEGAGGGVRVDVPALVVGDDDAVEELVEDAGCARGHLGTACDHG